MYSQHQIRRVERRHKSTHTTDWMVQRERTKKQSNGTCKKCSTLHAKHSVHYEVKS